MADARPPMRAKGGQNSLLAGIGAKIAVAVPSASDDRFVFDYIVNGCLHCVHCDVAMQGIEMGI
jgi:hypothetical protein